MAATRDFSFAHVRDLMLPCLATSGLPPERAWAFVRRVEDDLSGGPEQRLSFEQLRAVAREVLGRHDGDAVAERLGRWHDLERLERPLVVLIGGATGVGKSTIASRLSRDLGITRVSSTDFIRQVLRAVVPNTIAPELYRSTFELDRGGSGGPGHAEFERQVRDVMIGVRAVIERATSEGTSIIVEGIHLVPGLLGLESASDSVVVHIVLSVGDEDDHEERFEIRAGTSARPAGRYDDGLPEIRQIQQHVMATARRTGVPVIENRDPDSTVRDVLDRIFAAVDVALRAAGPEAAAA